MELTKTHIAQLYQFTRDHYVEWYDLQTELVDHLANDIEEIWQEKPTLSFENARDISFKKFGIFGFGEIVEQKQLALHKQYSKAIFKEFLQFFKLPKIILTIFLCTATFCLFSLFNHGIYIYTLIGLTVFVLPAYTMYVQYKKVKKRNLKLNKKWLFDGILFQYGFLPFCFISPFGTSIDLFYKASFTQNQLIFLSITFFLFNLVFYISEKVVKPNMQKKMVEMFPEYELG